MYDMASDEEVGRQILSIFMQHKVGANGVLRRNNFIDVRDADFQRGLNKAVENRWIKTKLRDRLHLRTHRSWSCCGIERWASAEAFRLISGHWIILPLWKARTAGIACR